MLTTIPFSYVQRLEARVAQLESLIPQESLDHIDGAQQQDQVMPDSWAEIQVRITSRADGPGHSEAYSYHFLRPWLTRPNRIAVL